MQVQDEYKTLKVQTHNEELKVKMEIEQKFRKDIEKNLLALVKDVAKDS